MKIVQIGKMFVSVFVLVFVISVFNSKLAFSVGQKPIEITNPQVNANSAYKILIIVDAENAKTLAEKYHDFLYRLSPFNENKRDIELEIQMVDAQKLDCKNTEPAIPRLLTCDNEFIRKVVKGKNANLTAVITSRNGGGSGGEFPVMSVNYGYNDTITLRGLLHEMMHTWGLADEYTYSLTEAKIYCEDKTNSKAPNVVSIKEKAQTITEEAAKSKYSRTIPWFSLIKFETAITTNGKLGTVANSDDENVVGLYRGGGCDNLLPSFLPHNYDTIMKTLNSDKIAPVHKIQILKFISNKIGRRLI